MSGMIVVSLSIEAELVIDYQLVVRVHGVVKLCLLVEVFGMRDGSVRSAEHVSMMLRKWDLCGLGRMLLVSPASDVVHNRESRRCRCRLRLLNTCCKVGGRCGLRGMSISQLCLISIRSSLELIFGKYFSSSRVRSVYVCDAKTISDERF